MKTLILLLICTVSLHALAAPKKSQLMAGVNFVQGKEDHLYWVTQLPGKKPKYILGFKEAKKKHRYRAISQGEAKDLQAAITRLIWESEFTKKRKPASKAKCHLYATLRTDWEQAKVCKENPAATAKTAHLLTDLSKKFK